MRGVPDEPTQECAVNDDWLDQITDFFDGSPTAQETLHLNNWIKADPRNVRRFVREVIVHSCLYDLLNGGAAICQQSDDQTKWWSGDTLVLPALSAKDEYDVIEVLLPPPPPSCRGGSRFPFLRGIGFWWRRS
jgi:hypothetical protein